MARSEELSGVQKAAVLLIALGPDKSANVFKHIKEDEIESIDTGNIQYQKCITGNERSGVG